jgi:hypothetical protein
MRSDAVKILIESIRRSLCRPREQSSGDLALRFRESLRCRKQLCNQRRNLRPCLVQTNVQIQTNGKTTISRKVRFIFISCLGKIGYRKLRFHPVSQIISLNLIQKAKKNRSELSIILQSTTLLRGDARTAPCAEGMDRQIQGQFRPRL